MYHPSRAGTRGGTDQFTWDSVKTDKHRENYLGHSVMAPVGRWQKGKDLSWYSKERKTQEGPSIPKKLDELASVKKAEEEAMLIALGFKPAKVENPTLAKEDVAEVLKRSHGEREVSNADRIEGVGTESVRASMMIVNQNKLEGKDGIAFESGPKHVQSLNATLPSKSEKHVKSKSSKKHKKGKVERKTKKQKKQKKKKYHSSSDSENSAESSSESDKPKESSKSHTKHDKLHTKTDSCKNRLPSRKRHYSSSSDDEYVTSTERKHNELHKTISYSGKNHVSSSENTSAERHKKFDAELKNKHVKHDFSHSADRDSKVRLKRHDTSSDSEIDSHHTSSKVHKKHKYSKKYK